MLVLVPTPIDETSSICNIAKEMILNSLENSPERTIIAVEDHKPARRRWISFGMPREEIDRFVLYNEHTHKDASAVLLSELQKGKTVYLMSDGGLPAFCDPGKALVRLCHEHKIKVTSTPFFNSISLAIALSGMDHDKFMFEGFISAKSDIRMIELKKIITNKYTTILMDTPYRLKKLLEDLKTLEFNRNIFVAIDLNQETEELHFGKVSKVYKQITDYKREFILLLES